MIGVKGDLSRKEGHAMTESTNGDNLKKVQLNLSEVENVKPFLNKFEKPTSTCSLTHSGTILFYFSYGKSQFFVWT